MAEATGGIEKQLEAGGTVAAGRRGVWQAEVWVEAES